MAKATSGEVTLKNGNRNIRLRLSIGDMLDLEDYFGMGMVPFLSKRLPEFRLKDMSVLFLAMTGKPYDDADELKKAAATIIKIGLVEVTEAISLTLEKTLNPQTPGK